MGRELLKLLAALGTGAATLLSAYLAGFMPPQGTNPVTAAIMIAVVAAIKRGIDALVAKAPAKPTVP